MIDIDVSSGYWTKQKINILEELMIMDKVKIIRGLIIVGLTGCAVKIVSTIKTRKECDNNEQQN